MALSVKRVQKLLRAGLPGKHTDGGAGGVKGLMLCIESKSSAAWILRYQRSHTIRHMGLGSARDVPLASARAKAGREREKLADGIDPLAVKRAERASAAAAAVKRLTFREAAERCHEAKEAGWTGARTADEFINSLQRWTFPLIGNLDVADVGKDHVLQVLEQKIRSSEGTFWTQRAVTADRVRSRVQLVLDWAEARDFRPTGTPNPARWRGFLDQLLPAPRKIRPVANLRALSYAEVPALMATLAADEAVAAKALQFIVLTACRVGEVLGATWDEINFDTVEWTIPKERMKGRREHRVPLSAQAIELLRRLYRENDNPHLFISTKTPGATVTDATVLRALRLAGCAATVHGFRSAFRDWAAECTNIPSVVAELSLAHRVGNAVENAYRRTDLFAKRRALLGQWATFCTTPPAAGEKKGKVLAMRGRA